LVDQRRQALQHPFQLLVEAAARAGIHVVR
jgi:hypothetical protein